MQGMFFRFYAGAGSRCRVPDGAVTEPGSRLGFAVDTAIYFVFPVGKAEHLVEFLLA